MHCELKCASRSRALSDALSLWQTVQGTDTTCARWKVWRVWKAGSSGCGAGRGGVQVPNALNGKFSWYSSGYSYGVWNGIVAAYAMPVQVILSVSCSPQVPYQLTPACHLLNSLKCAYTRRNRVHGGDVWPAGGGRALPWPSCRQGYALEARVRTRNRRRQSNIENWEGNTAITRQPLRAGQA